ncbi:hypothetical protein FRC08_005999 [Ceratobasidium sp. 394]|nr:hypothetical protein FRC08_005999 [Ceratobasidium sp. 394]
MNPFKRHFRHPSRRVTTEPPPDTIKHPKPTPASTPRSSRSTNDVDFHASIPFPQPITAAKPPLLGQVSQTPVSRVNAPTPALVSSTCPPVKFPAADNGTAHAKWTGLKRLTSVLGPSTKAFDFGPLKSAIDGIAKSIEVYEAAAEAHEEYKSLRNQLDWLFHDLADRFGESTPPVMRPSIMNLARGIEQELLSLRKKEHRYTPNRYIEAVNDADRVLRCYRRIHALLERLALNANINIWMLVDDQATSQRLDRLSPSHSAWYNSAESEEIFRDECTPDTRLEVLERLRVWQDDSESEKVYWLNGMAGTGKTTLAYTLCKQLEGDNKLAANFFCTRQLPSCRDAKLIVPTIAYQLANFSYPFRYAISQILDRNRDVHTRRISEQFEKLLYKPLLEIQCSLPCNLIIVIDGLDECDNDRGVGEILDALLNHVSTMPIKFFLTSRPESPIRSRMLRRRGDRNRFELHLHELDKGVIREDIKRYLRASLKHPDLTLSEQDLETLTKRSGVLFIYAATVVRYIGAYDFLRSNERLKDVLEATTGSNDSDQAISSLYNLILKRAFGDPLLIVRERDEMRLVLETAICTQEPLTLRTMAGLLGLKGERSVDAALGLLRSVLNVQEDGTITTLHKSFPDHMLDPTRSLDFCCDPKRHNGWLARRCFDLISTPCIPPSAEYGLDLSPTLDDLLHLNRKQQISGPLFYACRYWAVHLRLAERPEDIFNQLYRPQGFLPVRLLLWMEVANLTKFMQPGVDVPSWANLSEWGKHTEWSMVSEAVAVAISMQQHHLALEWLELGQSILWGQMLQVPTPYDNLYAGNLDMVRELQRVLYQPKFAGTSELVGRPSTHDARSLYDNTRKDRLAERRKELLDFARFLPGLEDSIQPPKASKLASLVQDGVAVVVNTYDGHLEPSFDTRFDTYYGARCDALVIRAGTQGITHVPLVELSVQKAEKAYSDLARCLSPPPPWRGFGKPDVGDPATADIFIMLWNDVAKPVLDHLGITHPLPAGELPHITWCTTGPLSALPLHAAGDYSSPSTMLPNLAISSYTPTLTLLNQQTFSPEMFSGILAMGGCSNRLGVYHLRGWAGKTRVLIPC